METPQYVKQTLDFQKTLFENGFNAIVLAQEQGESMFNGYLESMPWVTEENKKSLMASVEMTKKAQEDFKKAVDNGFIKFEEMLEPK